ncbi:hypothetical protein QUF80_04080 [Desulfococcaceae bacterium HSG8]|nr:hypothetical protein [Desulfococcaceae bacterium HSG8]
MLNSELQQKLVETLHKVPSSGDMQGRTALLAGLPHNIVNSLDRSDNANTDINNIISKLDLLGCMKDTGQKPLIIMAENARIQVEGMEIEAELTEIIRSLEKLPDKKEARTGFKTKRFNKLGDILPYLVDRKRQISAIKTKLSGNKPLNRLICLIHGDEGQCHDKFLECLKQYYWTKFQRPDSEQADLKLIDFEWPRYAEDFKEDIAIQLWEKHVRQTPYHDDANKIFQAVNASHKGPILIYTFIYTDDWQRDGQEIITRFLQFCKDWPKRAGDLLMCLMITYMKDTKTAHSEGFRFLKRLFRRGPASYQPFNKNIRKTLASQHAGIAIPELLSVKKSDVYEWSREVKSCIRPDISVEEVIPEIYESPGIENADGRIPMSVLARQLREKVIIPE